ncbi:hypothetical protein [Arthrobacter sp. QXT-31]|uniref:hypothetical protein n=1 Tax=Arthrobacter sp. QXT-31 TaxID=1357915 RepID=UPI000971BE99|nr:hypothetical protein [Arthrobacter sp. QXT-31]APX02458.1 hypothetical protein BWQ92_12745 [Arthrobacter sp. QXT-31]
MSVAPTPNGASRRRLLLILLAAVAVVLVGTVIALSAPGPSADQQAATAPASTTAAPGPASPSEEAAQPADAELLDEASSVCEMQVTEKYPTAEVQPGTKSSAKAKSGTFETSGSYTDPTAGKASPTEFRCSSLNAGGSWTVTLQRG